MGALVIFFKKKIFKILIVLSFISFVLIEKKKMAKFLINNGIPKISIFLPIYNKAKYLKRSISSIQRQSIKDIEIIAINDCSKDNSLKILKEMKKKDSRIKIINNKKNYGLLFSRGMGILNSKGEYLMNLDPDDEYRGKNNLKLLYNTAKKLNIDFITFFIFYLPYKKKSEQFSKFNKVLNQPELFESAFDNNNNLKDYFITNKFIKRELLRNAFRIFKKEIYDKKWNYHEDNIWSILLHKFANSSVFINKKIYYYYENMDSEMFNRGNPLDLKNLLDRNAMYKKILKRKNEEKYIISGYYELIDIFGKYLEILKKDKYLKIKSINDLNKFSVDYNISYDYKKKIDYLLSQLED